jgi:hypothetical protein
VLSFQDGRQAQHDPKCGYSSQPGGALERRERRHLAPVRCGFVLFEQRFWPGIADGSVTVTFRRWKRRQVVAGRRYRTPAGMIEVVALNVVDETEIDDEQALLAGYESASTLLGDLRGTPELPVFRIEFRYVDAPDPRDVLADTATLSATEVAEIDRRLDRFDAASPHGPWTTQTLQIIGRRPGVRAGDLAAELGRERESFKLDVRKLKNLGLTRSLEIGYRLSARGEAYLERRTPA